MSKYNTISTTSSTSAAQNSRSAYQIITSISKNLDSIEKPINAAISKLCVSCQAFNNFFLLQNDLETCIKNFSRKKIESYNTITYNRIQTVLSNVYNTFDQLPEEIRFSSAVFEGKIIITKTLKDMGKERLIPPQTIQTFCDRPSETASSRDALRPQEQRREYMIQRLMEPGSESRKNMYHQSVFRNNQSSSSSSTIHSERPHRRQFMPTVTTTTHSYPHPSSPRDSKTRLAPREDYQLFPTQGAQSFSSIIRQQQQASQHASLNFK